MENSVSKSTGAIPARQTLVLAYILEGFFFPIRRPTNYRWGRRCRSCDQTVLAPETANPLNYRQCRLCNA